MLRETKVVKANPLFRNPLNWIAAAILFSIVLIVSEQAKHNRGIDYYNVWAVPQAFRHFNDVDIYKEEDRRAIGHHLLQIASRERNSLIQFRAAQYNETIDPTATPFLYTFFSPFISDNYESSFRFFTLVSIACSLLAIIYLCRICGYSVAAALLIASFFLSHYDPLSSNLRVGNVNQIQLGFIALYLWVSNLGMLRRNNFVGGVTLGIMIMFKPNLILIPFLLGILWLLRRDVSRLSGSCLGLSVGALFSVVVSSLYFGSMHAWTSWIHNLRELGRRPLPLSLGNHAISTLVNELSGWNSIIFLDLLFFGSVAAAVWYFVRSHQLMSKKGGTQESKKTSKGKAPKVFESRFMLRDGENGDRQLEMLVVSLGCGLMIVTSTLVWTHYYVLLIPLMLCVPICFYSRQNISFRLRVLYISVAILATVMVSGRPRIFYLVAFSDYNMVILVSCLGGVTLFYLGILALAKYSTNVSNEQ